jgi:predicted aldo/keto reductase-like oxidoreductase
MKNSRREFLTKSMLGISSLGLASGFDNKIISKIVQEDKPKEILYRTLGKTGIKLPIVSMGVMNANLPELIPASYDLGVRHFDTARNYQDGKNERMVGEQIKELGVRDKVTIATKLRLPNAEKDSDKKKEFIDNLNDSLKRLQTDYVDILYVHALSTVEQMRLKPLQEAFMQLKKEKKVRFIGISTHQNMSDLLEEAAKTKFYDVVLTSINYTMSDDDRLIKAIKGCADAGIGVVAMKTQGGGRWYRDKSPEEIKTEMNATAVLKWALKVEGVTTAIPGYTNFDHMNESFSVAYGLDYTNDEIKFLKDKNALMGAAFCRQCQGCVASCPKNVDIPTLMRTSMYLVQYTNLSEARRALDSIDSSRSIKNCGSCTDCIANCSHYVNIAERIYDLKTVFV